MGGFGSGRRLGFGKACLDHLRQVDIRYMNRRSLLREGTAGTLSWSFRDKPHGSIRYNVQVDRLHLSYRITRRDEEEPRPVELDVFFDATRCNYGGTRKWFLCPACGRRVGVLYEQGDLFACRYCVGLSYAVESETRHDRALRKFRKLRDKLDDAPRLQEFIPLSCKPKGMRWRTFWRIIEKDKRIIHRIIGEEAKWLSLL
jgi:hypothetical protein